MTKMKPMQLGLLALSISAIMAFAPTTAQAKERSWIGYLVDCKTEKTISNKSDVRGQLSQYSRERALADVARTSGYALFANGKFYDLDSSGNTLAQQSIEKSVKKSGFYVMVKGTRKHKHIQVSSISDASDLPANSTS